MTSPAEDIKALLEAESSLALDFGTDLFVGDMPESPDNCICVMDTGGFAPSIGPYYHPSVQILVRGTVGSYSETIAQAQALCITLHAYYGTPSGSSFYYAGVWSLGDPFYIGVDENNRPLFSINFRIQRR